MDKSRRHDNPRAEVAGEEVNVEGYAESRDSFGDDWEESGVYGKCHNDEEDGDADAELPIVFVG